MTSRPRMTASWVTTAPEGDHTDPATAGLQLRVRKKLGGAARMWCFRYKWRGDPVRIVIGHIPGMGLADARAETIKLRQALDDGIDPRRARPRRRQASSPPSPSSAAARPGDKHTVDYLVSEFTERHLRATRKRPEYAEAILARDVLPPWRGRDARTIQAHEVLELLDVIVERGSKVMANRTAALLSQLFKFGIHRRIVSATPVQLLYRPGGKERARERVLSEEELQAFLADPKACTRFDRLSHVITLLLLTGQRRGELAAARWADVDLHAKTWTIPDQDDAPSLLLKAERGHVVPLTDWATKEFQALRRDADGSPWVLPAQAGGDQPINPKQLTRGVAKCQERFQKAGIQEFTLHDMRRTCRTGLSRLKVEPHIAERVLNHVQPGVAGVYDRFAYLDEKRAALEKWASHLQTLQR